MHHMDVALTNAFLDRYNVACTPSSQVLQSCSLDNIDVIACNAEFTCANYSDQTKLACDSSKVAQLLGQLTADLVAGNTAAANALMTALSNSPGISTDGTTLAQSVANFITLRCNIEQNVQQSVSAPRMVLDTCDNVKVVLMNRLDQSASCGLAQARNLLQSAGLGTVASVSASGKPYTVKGWVIGVLVGGAVVLLLIAVMLGLYLQRKRLNANYDAVIASVGLKR